MWLQLYQNYVTRVEQQELLAAFTALRQHCLVVRHLPPPPHYLHFYIPNLDEEPDLDPIPPYTKEEAADPPPPQWVPTPLPKEVEEMNAALTEAHLIAENHDLTVNPSLTEFNLL
ncbi:hypothetical protein BKA82DRAFT_34917 [Pisolithus tinctorius]|uniref:Uncharacterized protein n=1 Tax=Pisolithus tinctorius Marx 270 TaxID=870435 RepID=A0A0C3IBY7_PISTI|nr:hypothetical protein BKA82DRAFT_34917 [Pisolithus tinctorius]KIN94577.1 hypothetical protein M404DRAFT_34917 [Pisolithus tinctorius Marx 270]